MALVAQGGKVGGKQTPSTFCPASSSACPPLHNHSGEKSAMASVKNETCVAGAGVECNRSGSG